MLPTSSPDQIDGQGVAAHKDSSGWLTFLYQVGGELGSEVLSLTNVRLPVRPIPGSSVVNFGYAFETATDSVVKAKKHRMAVPGPQSGVRFSVPFFQARISNGHDSVGGRNSHS